MLHAAHRPAPLRAVLVMAAALMASDGARAAADSVRTAPPPLRALPGPAELPDFALLAVRINGVDQQEVVRVAQLPGGRVAVPHAALRAWHLRVPRSAPLRLDGELHHALDDVAGLQWQIDEVSQTLVLDAVATAFASHEMEVQRAQPPATAVSRTGAFINYDLQHQREQARGVSSRFSSGAFELGGFSPGGHGIASGVWRSRSASAPARWLRLDTQWDVDLPQQMSSVRLGDAIGHAGAWGRAARFGGVQWGTNFALRPGFVSFPMPGVRGEAALPSVVDLYVNDSPRLSGSVPPGPFDLPDVPVMTGQGQIRMVVRDLLGREQVVVQPYYVSPSLLRPGLQEFSVELGALRKDYGLASARYGRALLAATQRRGVSDSFTREWRAELLGTQQTVGLGGTWLMPWLGTLDSAAAASHAGAGQGAMLSGGLQRQATDWSSSAQVRVASRNFRQLGLGDAGPRASAVLGLGRSIAGGSIGASYLEQRPWQGERLRTLSANYSMGLGRHGYLGMFATRTLAPAGASTLGLQYTRMLDARHTASLGTVRSAAVATPTGPVPAAAQHTLQLQAQPDGDSHWGYQVLAQRGDVDYLNAQADLRTELATWRAGIVHTHSGGSASAAVSGGLALMQEGVFASRWIDGSFAVVNVGGYPGVRVQRDNHPVARTDAQGLAFVSGLRPHENNRLGVDAADLPLDAQVDALELLVAPGARSGVSVVMAVQRSRSATLRLMVANGSAVPPGSTVWVGQDEREFPVGLEGRLFVAGLEPRTPIVARWPQGSCRAELLLPPGAGELPDLGVVTCR